jgi:hypothetical protein
VLTTTHPEVKVQNMRLDLVAHAVSREVGHFEHLQDAAGISLAPFDERVQSGIEV